MGRDRRHYVLELATCSEDRLIPDLISLLADGAPIIGIGIGAQMTAIVNGFATILLFALIDQQISALTDDVVDGSVCEATFRRAMIWVSLRCLAGTLLAKALLIPAAVVIAYSGGWL